MFASSRRTNRSNIQYCRRHADPGSYVLWKLPMDPLAQLPTSNHNKRMLTKKLLKSGASKLDFIVSVWHQLVCDCDPAHIHKMNKIIFRFQHLKCSWIYLKCWLSQHSVMITAGQRAGRMDVAGRVRSGGLAGEGWGSMTHLRHQLPTPSGAIGEIHVHPLHWSVVQLHSVSAHLRSEIFDYSLMSFR